MLFFKACPKCETGTVQHESDPWGSYLQCVNCGFMRDLPEGVTPEAELARLQSAMAAERVALARGEDAAKVA